MPAGREGGILGQAEATQAQWKKGFINFYGRDGNHGHSGTIVLFYIL